MKLVNVVLVALLVSGVAHAQKKGGLLSQVSGQGYGSAGCGFGSIVMGSDGNQVLAATTNGTSGSQTFGISTGTLNCQQDGIFKSGREVPAFIEVNKLALANDAARGQGETLAGLANLMGCNSSAFAPVMKKNYNKIFVETNMQPAAIEANINAVVAQNNVCGA
ncbi:DUF3015 family protein [Bdellovibrio bacteriovorus]|uniref:DUF3015 family protein n=1 Tax=Bdellovibrio bacteriovorus TaxID=959 RepID=UPI000AF2CCF1|nr:DUF3015 family protein [Bdellovibrio bacteriovorus]